MEIEVKDLYRISFCDPAGSKKNRELKKIRARSAIVSIGVDVQRNRIFVLDAWASAGTTDQLIDKIISVNRKWRPKIFGIEANAMQSVFADAVHREMRFKGERIPIFPHNQPTRIEKDTRIRDVVQPILRDGRLFLHELQVELITEMRSFPTGKTKDIVDALASAISLAPKRAVVRQRNEEAEALAQYLRESGAPMWYIEEQLRGKL